MTLGIVVACVVVAALLWPSTRRSPGTRRWPGARWPGTGRWPPGVASRPVPPRDSGRVDLPDVADALVLVALALRAGLSVVESLEQAAVTTPGRAQRDLAAVASALRWGRPTAEAWGYADPVWRPAALAFEMSQATGAGPADLLQAAADRLREEQERDRERRAARAGVLLVLPLGFGFLPAFACTAVVPLVVVLADGALGGAP